MSSVEIDESFDFGFTAIDDERETLSNVEDRLQKMYKLIMPLINNLMKDSNKANIHWPNRKEKLLEFKSKLEAILNEGKNSKG